MKYISALYKNTTKWPVFNDFDTGVQLTLGIINIKNINFRNKITINSKY